MNLLNWWRVKAVDFSDLRWFFFSFLPRVLPWRAATSSEVIQMHALLHRRTRRYRNCGALTRPPINYLKEQRVGSHLLPSSTEPLDFKYNNIWDFCWFGELKELHAGLKERSRTPGGRRGAIDPNRCRSNVNRFAPSPAKIDAFLFFGAVSASGCNHSFVFLQWQIWSHLSELKRSSPNPKSLHLCPQTTARLDPKVPLRSDPASNVMGKMTWYRVTQNFLDQRHL